MYGEADGADDVRRAVREQLRRGADFVKVMSAGARSLELEGPDPARLTRAEIATLVEEAHRQGYRVAARADWIDGTEIAIEEGVDTIEHGMYLSARTGRADGRRGQVLVPTVSCFDGFAGVQNQVGIGEQRKRPPERPNSRPPRRGRRYSSSSPTTTSSRPT